MVENIDAESGKQRRYRLARNKDNKLEAWLSYYNSGTSEYEAWVLQYTSATTTTGPLFLFMGGTGGQGWTASNLFKTAATLLPAKLCPFSLPLKSFASSCAASSCTDVECCESAGLSCSIADPDCASNCPLFLFASVQFHSRYYSTELPVGHLEGGIRVVHCHTHLRVRMSYCQILL